MTKRYRGTCIGGIADGHYIERDDPEIKISARRAGVVDPNNPQVPQEQVLVEDVYKFLLLFGNTNNEIGVWAVLGMSVEQVVERLVRCYNPRTGLIGTPNPNALAIRRQ